MKPIKFKPHNDLESYRLAIEMQAIGKAAVHKAQEKNRRLGIPNYYSINGRIISDAQEIPQTVEIKNETPDRE